MPPITRRNTKTVFGVAKTGIRQARIRVRRTPASFASSVAHSWPFVAFVANPVVPLSGCFFATNYTKRHEGHTRQAMYADTHHRSHSCAWDPDKLRFIGGPFVAILSNLLLCNPLDIVQITTRSSQAWTTFFIPAAQMVAGRSKTHKPAPTPKKKDRRLT